MPLPGALHELITRLSPELPELERDQLDQLEAYLRAPDRVHFRDSELQQEKLRGGTALHTQLRAENDYLTLLRRVAVYNRARMEREPVSKRRPDKRKRSLNGIADRRLFEQWESGAYRTYSDLANMVGSKRDEVRRAIDRHRKRLRKRTPE